ncbi:MAG: PIG-L deacetylase family protein [bacterium]
MEEVDFKEKIIMAIAAHPDDSDFGCGATMAKAVKMGAKVIYLVATSGQRGSSDRNLTSEKLSQIRKKEQGEAAKVLGISEVHFLDYFDGELVANIELKEKIVRFIRKYNPDIVFTTDPSYYYFKDRGLINHSDHRAVGEAALDAVYPLARDFLSFTNHQKEGLEPHKVKELFFHSLVPEEANCFIDVAETIDLKIKALSCHKSQVPDAKALEERIKNRALEVGKIAGFDYAESFVRLVMAY